MSRRATDELVALLRGTLRGSVSAAPTTLEGLSHDFGGLYCKRPRVVVRPAGTADVVHVMRTARQQGIPVGVRAGGHSLSGQSLVRDGILLDMRAMHRIHAIDAADLSFDVEPGVVWHDLVIRTSAIGLIPPVLTGTLRTTVGGTHSIGGLGHASFRHGSQIDHCLSFEIVTGDGEVRQCSATENVALFQHALGGLGLFGVITRIRGRLRRVPAFVRQYTLLYSNRGVLLDDLRRVAAAQRADGAGAYGTRFLDKWLYTMDLTVESPTDDAVGDEAALDGLRPSRVAGAVTRPVREQLLRYELVDAGEPRNHVQAGGNPWVDSLLPAEAVAPFFTEALARLPRVLRDNSTLLAWPLDGDLFTRPLLRRPSGRALQLASIFPNVPAALVADAKVVMTGISDLADSYGGTRYAYGWMEQNLHRWSSHYGDAWATIRRLKAQYDPDGLLAHDRFFATPPVASTPASAVSGRPVLRSSDAAHEPLHA